MVPDSVTRIADQKNQEDSFIDLFFTNNPQLASMPASVDKALMLSDHRFCKMPITPPRMPTKCNRTRRIDFQATVALNMEKINSAFDDTDWISLFANQAIGSLAMVATDHIAAIWEKHAIFKHTDENSSAFHSVCRKDLMHHWVSRDPPLHGLNFEKLHKKRETYTLHPETFYFLTEKNYMKHKHLSKIFP